MQKEIRMFMKKECLNIVFTITRFQPPLYGRKFILETVYKPLAYLAQANHTWGRLMRWSLYVTNTVCSRRHHERSPLLKFDWSSHSGNQIETECNNFISLNSFHNNLHVLEFTACRDSVSTHEFPKSC